MGKRRRIFMASITGIALLGAWSLFGPTDVGADGLPVDTLPFADESVPQNGLEPPAVTSFFAGQPVAGQPGADVNLSNLVGNESEVSIDVNPTNPQNQVVVGHAAGGFATMNTFFTMDGGATWTLVALGNAQDGLTSTFRFDPTVAFDDNGNVYAAYGARIAGPTRRVVVVCQSTDGGATYPQCTTVATTADIGNLPGNDKWHLATGPDPITLAQQNVYIAWTQNVSEPGTDQRIVVSASTDGGATFSAPVIINDASIAGTSSGNLFADPAVGPNGEVYVSWNDINNNQVLVDVSFDGGVTWNPDNFVTASATGFKSSIPPQPDRGVFVGPTLDVDRTGGAFSGRLYVTYTDVPNGLPDTDIFVRSSIDDGATWSAANLVNDDGTTTSQFLPWLDVDQQTGLVSVVFYDARNDITNNQKVDIYLAVSDDGGATFGPNILVSDGQSDQSTANNMRTSNNYLEYIGVASFDCDVFPVWSDNSTNLADLDYFTDQVQITGLDTDLCILEVDIDVKAFSNVNGFSCRKKGVLPVTIWGKSDFDVSEIDLSTVVLKLTNGTDVGGPVVNSLICDRGDPDIDQGSSGGALVADCFDAAGLPGQDSVADKEGGTLDGFDDIDVRFDAKTVIGNICTGASRRDIIPTNGLVIMGELNDGTPFTSVPFPDVGIDQLLVLQAPKP